MKVGIKDVPLSLPKVPVARLVGHDGPIQTVIFSGKKNSMLPRQTTTRLCVLAVMKNGPNLAYTLKQKYEGNHNKLFNCNLSEKQSTERPKQTPKQTTHHYILSLE